MFISFEGINGAGVTTQARALAEYLTEAGHQVVSTREPGGSPGAEEIRSLILQGDAERWSSETEIMLRAAARRDHMERLILPALKAGKFVLCDTFVDCDRIRFSNTRHMVDEIHRCMIGDEPHLTFLIDTDPEATMARYNLADGGHWLNTLSNRALSADRKAYLQLAEQNEHRFRVIDGNKSPREVLEEIITHLQMEDILPVLQD